MTTRLASVLIPILLLSAPPRAAAGALDQLEGASAESYEVPEMGEPVEFREEDFEGILDDPASPPPPNSVAEKVQRECLDRDFSGAVCFADDHPAFEASGIWKKGYDGDGNPVPMQDRTSNALSQGLTQCRYIDYAGGHMRRFAVEGQFVTWDWLHARLAERSSGYGWCAKLALANCVTDQTLKFEEAPAAGMQLSQWIPPEAMAAGMGANCSGFARFARFLLEQMGVEARIVATKGEGEWMPVTHMMVDLHVEYKGSATWLRHEPQVPYYTIHKIPLLRVPGEDYATLGYE